MTTHPSPLARSTYVDGELPPAETLALERHLDGCDSCRARVAALRSERALLREMLSSGDELVPIPAIAKLVPTRSFGLADWGFAFACVAVVGWLASAAWTAVDEALPAWLTWLSPLDARTLIDSFVSLLVFVTREGSSMLTSITQTAALAVLVALFAWGAAALVRRNAGHAAMLSVVLLVLALPQLGHAFELRRSDTITTVAAGETVDDTLLAVGKEVTIDGDVNGDLLAFGERVIVRGNVQGDMITGAQSVEIRGTIFGNLIGGAGELSLTAGRVRGNVYAGAGNLTTATGTVIDGNAFAGAGNISLAGNVGRDVLAGTGSLTISGNVERNVRASGGTITIAPPARVGGNLSARVDTQSQVRVTPGTVIGTVDTQMKRDFAERQEAPRSKYASASFYLWQVVRLGAAFLTGLVLLALFPGLQTLSLAGGMGALRAAGIGLVTAVSLPAIVFIACVTVIGIPLGLLVGALWMLGLYFAKTLVAQLIGRELFKARGGATPHFAATLLAGLVLVLIAVNLPYVGWLVGLALSCIGLGMLVGYLNDRSGNRVM